MKLGHEAGLQEPSLLSNEFYVSPLRAISCSFECVN